jgi:hypothetical protein
LCERHRVRIVIFLLQNVPAFWRPREVAWFLLLLSPSVLQGAPVTLSYAGSQRLPEVVVAGCAAVIHVQGLYVTDAHFYITGRLERDTCRALFLAFDRTSPNHYDVLDITPPAGPALGEDNSAANRPRAASRLDHPGGFDSDGRAFWIPVAVSRPRGPTAVVRLEHSAGQPPSKWHWHIAFRVDDHIGALAWDAVTGRLYGANWDTRRVYTWSTDGEERAAIARADMVKGQPDWSLAVQDWKGLRDSRLFPPGTLVAGGIDKGPSRNAALSSAVVEWLDPIRRKRLAQARLGPAPHHPGAPTREGLAWYHDQLYLLPSDLGRGATILRYRCQRAATRRGS